MTYTFSLDPNASKEDIAAVHKGLREYNAQFAPWEGSGSLNIFLRDEQGTLAGGADRPQMAILARHMSR